MMDPFNSVGICIQDFWKGTSILKTKRFLEETQRWPDEKILHYRNNKFRKLLEHSIKNVPYYASLFQQNNIKLIDINHITDIRKLPILNKEIARSEKERLCAKEGLAKAKKGKTGGTTGVPLTCYKDINSRSFAWGAFYRWYDWMGIKIGDPMLEIWGAATVLSESKISKLKKNVIYLLQNIRRIDSFSMNENTMPVYIGQIKKFKPKLIRGYLSGILQLANYIKENNIKGIMPVAVAPTTETLLPHLRKFLEEVFCAPVFDQYGCGEVSAIAFECRKHEGLHINQEHVVVEVLDDHGEPVHDQPGRLVVTDLDNFAMPFIRYENGDSAVYSTKPCTCGVNQPLLAQISGRTADTIVLKNGSKVHGVFFTDILYELQKEKTTFNIKRFQVYQEIAGNIEFRIEAKEALPDSYIVLLEKALNRFFNSVSIKLFTKLENEPSGKFKYVKSCIHEAQTFKKKKEIFGK